MPEKEAWRLYSFINEYKEGNFGLVTLQNALDSYYKDYVQKEPLKSQIGDVI